MADGIKRQAAGSVDGRSVYRVSQNPRAHSLFEHHVKALFVAPDAHGPYDAPVAEEEPSCV